MLVLPHLTPFLIQTCPFRGCQMAALVTNHAISSHCHLITSSRTAASTRPATTVTFAPPATTGIPCCPTPSAGPASVRRPRRTLRAPAASPRMGAAAASGGSTASAARGTRVRRATGARGDSTAIRWERGQGSAFLAHVTLSGAIMTRYGNMYVC